jgi:PHD/YefM family antitoxin component YafN of YafNO toxin-antitoxin module
MNISQFIDDVVAGNASAAKETLNDILSAKAFESIDMQKKELARSVFGGQQESFEEITDDEEAYAEDVEVDGEQLDELSKSTLKSYIRKAGDQASDSKQELDHLKRSPDAGDRSMARDAGKTYVKRTIGVHQAANKLNNG